MASTARLAAAPAIPPARLTKHQAAETLRELCALGLIEKFTDDHGIDRFRPIFATVFKGLAS